MATVHQLRMNDATLLRIIRELAADTAKVFITTHAKKAMRKRRISTTQVYACLRRGSVDEPAHRVISGNWRCTLRHLYAGDDVRVVAELERDDDGDWVVVITTF